MVVIKLLNHLKEDCRDTNETTKSRCLKFSLSLPQHQRQMRTALEGAGRMKVTVLGDKFLPKRFVVQEAAEFARS